LHEPPIQRKPNPKTALQVEVGHDADPQTGAAPGHTTEALLLSYMDYRLIDDITRYMDGRGLTNQYDHIVLAGASLGALTSNFKDWNQTFWEHLKISSDLHHIKKVILMDHRDCGAYKVILKADFSKDPQLETRIHGKFLRDLMVAIHKRYPELEVERLLMNLDGTVQKISRWHRAEDKLSFFTRSSHSTIRRRSEARRLEATSFSVHSSRASDPKLHDLTS